LKVDRWWTDLAEFLRSDGVVPHRLPRDPIDPGEFLPVYVSVNEVVKALWTSPPRPLHWRGLEKAVLSGSRLFTSGPVTWGMRYADEGWEWWVAIANRGYPGVSVPVEAIRAAARAGGLPPSSWNPTDDQQKKRIQVFETRRRLVAGETASEAADWIAEALRQLRVAGMLEPHFEAVRTKDQAAAQRRAERQREGGDILPR
jgi:hypothetical protein